MAVLCMNFEMILSHGKSSEKAPEMVPFGRENDEGHVPAHPAHMCEMVYLANPALHMGLELHGDLNWIWCKVSVDIVQMEKTVTDLRSPSQAPCPKEVSDCLCWVLSVLLETHSTQQVINSQAKCTVDFCVFFKVATSQARTKHYCWSLKGTRTVSGH